MTEDKTTNQSKSKTKKVILTTDTLNFVIAVCAILISGASFYATYLQAKSAEKQVQAMTLPIIQFGNSNFDPDLNQRAILFTLNNAGTGPAIIRSIDFLYKDERYNGYNDFLHACCDPEFEAYWKEMRSLLEKDQMKLDDGVRITASLKNVILSGQSDYRIMGLYYGELSKSVWDRLDKERRQVGVEICYCTLFDDCYTTKGDGIIEPVAGCRVE